ncbi:MAG TPA: DUF6689 family protein [Rhodanobacteraceae bacterium]|nr:DUF6689 family protein [Rhodanobacteraceae bacterium]
MNSPKRWQAVPALAVATLLLHAAAVSAGGVVVTIIGGDKARADITLPNPGGGNYTAEFELEFEPVNLQNLTVQCIGITADVLDAGEIANIQSRLPHPGNQIIDPAFPVRVTVEPPVACGLAFQDQYDVTLDTDDLVYAPFSPYRLVKAPIGQAFQYVTGTVTAGSVRSRGRAGGFSEFVIIKDNSPQYSIDCESEYNDLAAQLAAATLSPSARRTLEVDLAVSRAAYEAGDFQRAITLLANFDAHCAQFGGTSVPNRWRSARDLIDVEGNLVGGTDSLRFMMGRLSGSP